MYREYHEDMRDQKSKRLEQYAVLQPADVMEILGIGKNTVYDLLNSGELRGFRIGRSWRILADELDGFMHK